MDVEDEVSWCAMEAADGIKEEGTEVMPTATSNPLEIGGVEATRTGNGNQPRNVGIVARKARRRVNAGRSELIRRKPDPNPVKPTREMCSDHTMPKDPKRSKRRQPS